MPAEVVTVGFCPQYLADFEVGSSRCKHCRGRVKHVKGKGWVHGEREAAACGRGLGTVAEPDRWWRVTLNGPEHQPSCDCPAFARSGGYDERDCKHVRLVWEHGCLWNPQWKDAGPDDLPDVGARYVDTPESERRIPERCRGCGRDCVPVRIAV